MRKIVFSLLVVMAAATAISCSDEETYGDKKEKERNAISEFINDSAINVISEAQFKEQDSTTNLANNEYVYLDKSGVYMQIVRKGSGEPLEENKSVNVLCRYYEYNILDEVVQSRNDIMNYYGHYYDKMTVTRVSSTYSATFVSGMMKETYGTSSVPSGWLVPLPYINLGREQDKIAKVKLIVPHTQGHAYASQSVYPCFYIITYQREK